MKIKVKFTNKENLETVINEIKLNSIRWITQSGGDYTIFYEKPENRKIKTLNKSNLEL